MKNKNGIIAFALLGLVAGTAAYYLLGTEDGKKRLKSTSRCVKDLTKSLNSLSKKQAKKASKLVKTAQSDLEKLSVKAKETGQHAINIVSDVADKLINKAENS